MAKRILHLVRHGQYTPTTTLPDEPDGPLTNVGKEQAALIARRLAGLPASVIHHSTLQRATETARAIGALLPGVELRPAAVLCECIPTVPPGFEAHFTDVDADVLARGGPQAREAFATYFVPAPDETDRDETDRHEVIVSSGNLIRYLICRVLGAPEDAWVNMDIQQCGLCEVIVGQPRGMVLARHNDTGHLPPALQLY